MLSKADLTVDVDLLSEEAVRDPYPQYIWLREYAPVHWNARLGAWVLTEYDDVRAAFRDARLSSDRVSPVYAKRRERDEDATATRVGAILSRWIVFNDPPAHTRLRKLVEYAFRPRAVERMDAIVQDIVDEYVDVVVAPGAPPDEAAATRESKHFDFVSAFAEPLPVRVIASMLDVPTEYHAPMARWSDEIVTLVFGARGVADREQRAAEGLEAFASLVETLLAERRAHPGEDLISDLVSAQERGDTLSDDEIIATCVLLLFAGHETTRNLLANGLKVMLEDGEAWAALCQAPDRAPDAVEEVLRFDGPIKSMWRLAAEPAVYQKVEMAPGDRVLLIQSAANRDAKRFNNPEKFLLERPANRHVAFGYAIHYCLGAAIARLEGTLAFKALAERVPSIKLATQHFDYEPFIVSRTVKSLPVNVSV